MKIGGQAGIVRSDFNSILDNKISFGRVKIIEAEHVLEQISL